MTISWLDLTINFNCKWFLTISCKAINEWQKHEAIGPEKLAKFPKEVLISFWIRGFVRYVSHEEQALKYKTHD